MGRRHRIHEPGAAHHVVTRIQGQEPLFVEVIRDQIAEILRSGIPSAGAQLIAFAVMPNHLHALLFQGQASLGWTMQPVLRRIAILVQRYHGITGHVFERRFRSKLCSDQKHLRNSILYIHRNPLKAKLCTDASAYAWTSHAAFAGTTPCLGMAVEEGLHIVACTSSGEINELRAIYLNSFAAYCGSDDGDDAFAWVDAPRIARQVRTGTPMMVVPQSDDRQLIDVRDAVMHILKAMNVECDLELLRSSYRGKHVFEIRTQVIASLVQRGYSGDAIANYLRVSPSTVSRVRAFMRWGTRYPAVPRTDSDVGQYAI